MDSPVSFRLIYIFVFLGLILFSAPVASASATSDEYGWNFTVIDTDGNAGGYCSVAFSPVTHNPVISYTEIVSKDLRVAWYDGSQWNINRDVARNASYNDISFNSTGYPAIVFYSDTPEITLRLTGAKNFEWESSQNWDESIINPKVGTTKPSIVYNNSDIPFVSYFNSANKISYAYSINEIWQNFEISSSSGGSKYSSIALNPLTGYPAIVYLYPQSDQKIYYREYDGENWKSDKISYNSSNIGFGCSLAFNSDGYPGGSYVKNTGDLYYAWHNGISWNYILVDDVGSDSKERPYPYTSLDYNNSDCPGISYYDRRDGTNGDLKFATCNFEKVGDPSAWEIENVFFEADSGLYNDFGFDPETDLPYIAFYREDGENLNYGSLYFAMKGKTPEPDFNAIVYPESSNMTVSFSDMTYSQTFAENYLWNFGDNSSYSGKNPPAHKYPCAGIYTVSLNVSNRFGESYCEKEITVPTFSNISVNKTSGTAPLHVMFSDKSIGVPDTWNLSFGDGSFYNTSDIFSDDGMGITHVYENPGNYTVSLSTEKNGIFNETVYEKFIVAEAYVNETVGNGNEDDGDGEDETVGNGNERTSSENSNNNFKSSGSYYGNAPNKLYNVRCSPYLSSACSSNLKKGDIFSFYINTGFMRKFSAAFGEDVSNVMFEVSKVDFARDLFKEPLGPVYGYGAVHMSGAPESSVVALSASFEVSKNWLSDVSMTENDVTFLMYVLENKTWVELPVEFEGCDDEFCSYTVRIPKISYYAVSARKNTKHMPKNTMDLKDVLI